MDLIVREDLNALMKEQAEDRWPRVSIFMPTHKGVKYNQQDPIRFRNLLRRAEELLVENGMRRPDAERYLKPAQGLLCDQMFWQRQSEGLAVFQDAATIRYFRLPLKFDELVTAGDRFQVKPLLPLFRDDGRFYVLAVSQHRVRLLQGSHYYISEVNLRNIPESMPEALRHEVYEHAYRFHGNPPGRGRNEQTAYYGQGGAALDVKKDELFRYFRQIDGGLHQYLRDDKSPLVLAGVEYLLPIYRDANTYQHILDETIRGNPDIASTEELHRKAWEIVKPYFQQAQRESLARYQQLAGEGLRTSIDIKTIVPAAYTGRVETLFIAEGVKSWGKYNECTNVMHFHGKEEPGDEDLLDLAAIQALKHNASVYVIDPGKMPSSSALAAIFRF